MWDIAGNDLYVFRTPGGDVYTSFVDDLLRVHTSSHKVPSAEIITNLRTNKKDGGVDTQVRVAVPGDDTGWMNVPTCWQFKARQSGEIKDRELIEEINKPYAAELIKKGYGYRLCICDDFPPETVKRWEEILQNEIVKINKSAPPPHVLNASSLAKWASR